MMKQLMQSVSCIIYPHTCVCKLLTAIDLPTPLVLVHRIRVGVVDLTW